MAADNLKNKNKFIRGRPKDEVRGKPSDPLTKSDPVRPGPTQFSHFPKKFMPASRQGNSKYLIETQMTRSIIWGLGNEKCLKSVWSLASPQEKKKKNRDSL